MVKQSAKTKTEIKTATRELVNIVRTLNREVDVLKVTCILPTLSTTGYREKQRGTVETYIENTKNKRVALAYRLIRAKLG